MTASGVLLCLGYILMSSTDSLWQLYVFYGILIGIGMGSPWVSLLSTTARWFISRRSAMTGIVLIGTGIGMMIASPAANHLISVYDWRKSFTIIGLVVGVAVILLSQFLKRDPAQIGQMAYSHDKSADRTVAPPAGFTLKEALRTSQLWIICFMFICFGIAMFSVTVHLVPHAIHLGIRPEVAALILAVQGGATIVGRLVLGGVADKVGNRSIFFFGFILLAADLFWLAYTQEVWGLYLFAVIFGVMHAGMGVSESPLVAGYFGLKYHGSVFGITSLAFCLGGAFGPWVTGYIFDLTGDYLAAFTFSAVICLIGLALTVVLKQIRSSVPSPETSAANHK